MNERTDSNQDHGQAQIHDLAASYTLDALDAADRNEFEVHLATCARCQIDIKAFSTSVSELAETLEVAPPAELKRSVMSQLGSVSQEGVEAPAPAEVPVPEAIAPVRELRRQKRFNPPMLLAAAASVLLVLGVAAFVLTRSSTSQFDEVVAAPDALVTELDPQAASVSGSIEIVWSAERNEAAVVADGLSDPGEGKAYQLWSVQGDVVTPAPTFKPSENGVIESSSDVGEVEPDAWAITIEDEQGATEPTTDILFVGTTV